MTSVQRVLKSSRTISSTGTLACSHMDSGALGALGALQDRELSHIRMSKPKPACYLVSLDVSVLRMSLRSLSYGGFESSSSCKPNHRASVY
ncbi:uncharacterized [Tachysurus ichikawai]